jgi:hypothetical protein
MDRYQQALQFWARNPVEAVKDWFDVVPEDYQGDIIQALLAPDSVHNRTAVKSGHGVGKTTTEAWCAWVFLMTRMQCKVVATAPTSNQLLDILWPEIGKWRLKMPPEMAAQWVVSATHVRHKEFDKTWFATARTSNKQENMQGFHENNILVIVEEASGVDEPIFEVIEGILTNANEEGQEAKLLLAGNPTQIGGEFFNAFHRNKHLYNKFSISGDRTTEDDGTGSRHYFSKRVSEAFRSTMASKYGIDGAVYDVRVRGVFPRESDDVVIPLSWAENAQSVNLPVFDKHDQVTLVMDVARFGGDETVLATFKRGHCINMEVWPKTSTVRCVDILVDACEHGSYGVNKAEVIRVVIDEPGVGGGVVDGARRAELPVVPYNGGAALVKDVDPEEDFRMFANRRSRDWWHLRRLFEQKQRKIPEDEMLINQLCSVKYDYMNEKIKVEAKKDMRKRLGEDASPDRADTLVMGMAPYIGVHSQIALENIDIDDIQYGEDRVTADMDF